MPRVFQKYYSRGSADNFSSLRSELLNIKRTNQIPVSSFYVFRRNDERLIESFNSHFERYYDSIMWYDCALFCVTAMILCDMSRDINTIETDEQAIAVRTLLIVIHDEMEAIRLMILNGHEVQAQILSRTLKETCFHCIALVDNPEQSVEFMNTIDEEAANEYWYKFVRKVSYKNVRKFFNKIKTKNEKQFNHMLNYIESMDKHLSTFVHPSRLMAVKLFGYNWTKWDDSDEQEQIRAELRSTTLSSCAYVVMLMMISIYLFAVARTPRQLYENRMEGAMDSVVHGRSWYLLDVIIGVMNRIAMSAFGAISREHQSSEDGQ